MNELNLVAENLWEVTCPLRLGPFQLDHRMSVVRLTSGALWVHSPVPLSDTLRRELDDLGRVEYLVAPSVYHDLHWPAWFAAYPEACFSGPPGLAQARPELPFSLELKAEPHVDWRDDIDQLTIEGMPAVNETVFLHRSSGTLIAADLVFNYDARSLDFLTRQLLRMMGTDRGLSMSRLFGFGIKDHVAMRRSLERILSWEFDRLIVGHGTVMESGARSALDGACHGLMR